MKRATETEFVADTLSYYRRACPAAPVPTGYIHMIPAASVASELRGCSRYQPERARMALRLGVGFLRAGSYALSHRVIH